jgi:hypothetical protein
MNRKGTRIAEQGPLRMTHLSSSAAMVYTPLNVYKELQ